MEENKVIWFLIYLVLGCAVIWGIGSFVTFDMLWFWHTWVGRLIGIIFFIAVLSGAIKEADEL